MYRTCDFGQTRKKATEMIIIINNKHKTKIGNVEPYHFI